MKSHYLNCVIAALIMISCTENRQTSTAIVEERQQTEVKTEENSDIRELQDEDDCLTDTTAYLTWDDEGFAYVRGKRINWGYETTSDTVVIDSEYRIIYGLRSDHKRLSKIYAFKGEINPEDTSYFFAQDLYYIRQYDGMEDSLIIPRDTLRKYEDGQYDDKELERMSISFNYLWKVVGDTAFFSTNLCYCETDMCAFFFLKIWKDGYIIEFDRELTDEEPGW